MPVPGTLAQNDLSVGVYATAGRTTDGWAGQGLRATEPLDQFHVGPAELTVFLGTYDIHVDSISAEEIPFTGVSAPPQDLPWI